MLPKIPACLPSNSPSAIPSGSGASRIAGVMPSNETPALAKPNSGTTPNATVAFGVVPLFGFANAGVSFDGMTPAILLAPLPLGIALGLLLGKQAGIFGSIWLAARIRFVARPVGASWSQIYGIALL